MIAGALGACGPKENTTPACTTFDQATIACVEYQLVSYRGVSVPAAMKDAEGYPASFGLMRTGGKATFAVTSFVRTVSDNKGATNGYQGKAACYGGQKHGYQ